MTLLILLGSLALITVGAEALVRGASVLALRAGVSALFVGLTIVGFGTSSPELAASLTATGQGSHGVAVGNVVGSNLFNLGVILGITALVHPIRVRLRLVRRDLLVALAAATVPTLTLLSGGRATTGLGVGLVVALGVYLVVAFRSARTSPPDDASLARDEVDSTLALDTGPIRWREGIPFNVSLVGLGLVLLVSGSRWFVGSAVEVAGALGVSDLIIGLTIVSAGTSLPELITSVVAARRRSPDIAIGNVIGSNIFNVLGILGTCAVVSPQEVGRRVALFDGPLVFLATLALVPILWTGGVVSRREGLLLLAAYVGYLVLSIRYAG